MKKIKLFLLGFVALGSVAHGEDKYWIGPNGNWWGDSYPQFWSTPGAPAAGDNVIFDYSKTASPTSYSLTSYIAVADNAVLNMGDFRIQNYITTKSGSSDTTVGGGLHSRSNNLTLNFNSIQINSELTVNNDGKPSSGTFRISSSAVSAASPQDYKYFTLNVARDVNVGSATDVKGSRMYLGLGGDCTGSGENSNGRLAKLTIGGDLNIYGACGLDMGVGSNLGSQAAPDVTITGILNLNSLNGDNPTWRPNVIKNENVHTYIAVGGIKGNAVVENGINNAKGGSATIILNNAKGTVYKTAATFQDVTTGVATNSKIGFIMAGEGTQIFNAGWEIDKRYFTGGIKMQNGTLRIRTQAVDAIGNIEIKGGRFGAANMSGGDATGFGVGTLFGGNVVWGDKGALLIDIVDTAASLLTFKSLNKESDLLGTATKFMIEFDSKSTILNNHEYKIVSFGDSNMSDTDFISNAADFGKDATFRTDAGNLYVTFAAAVPEPATCAAILGIAVLLIALRRKN